MKKLLCSKLTALLTILSAIPVLLTAQSIRISNGGFLVLNGAVNLVLNDMAFINDSRFVSNGNNTVLLTGVKTVNLGGKKATSFGNLTIQKNANNVQLVNGISVTGIVNIVRGNLLLNNNLLDLGKTGTIKGEINNRCIMGTNGGGSISVMRFVPAGTTINPGNIGIELTCTTDAGLVTVVRSHVSQTMPNGAVSIQRKYVATAANPTGAKLRFFYLDNELAGNNENGLVLWTASGAGNFPVPIGKDSNNITANWVLKNNADPAGSFTLANPDGVSSRVAQPPPVVVNPVREQVSLFPNPGRNSINLELIIKLEKQVHIRLVDQSGRILQQKNIFCKVGKNNITWDIHSYPSGVYFFSFDNNALQELTFIKE